MVASSNRKIKIAHIITRLDWGGSPDILRNLYAHLDSAQYDLQLIIGQTRHPTIKTEQFLTSLGGKLVRIPQLQRDINLFRDAVALVKLFLFLRRQRFDIVHTHTAKAGALGRLAARLAGVPVVVHTPHGHNFYGYFGWFLTGFCIFTERLLVRLTDMIICLTELEKDDFLRYKVAEEEKLTVIYQGLELSLWGGSQEHDSALLRKRFGIKEHARVVGMIGRLEPVKDPLCFVEAAIKILRGYPDTQFLIVGEGSLRAQVEERIKERGLVNRCILTGWQEDVSSIFPLLEVFVLSSLNEAVGMVLIEAQMMRIPVVATAVGGIPEIIQHQKTGLLVPPADAHALSRAVITLLGDTGYAQRLAEEGQRHIQERFSLAKMVEQTSVLYARLTGNSLGPRVSP